MRALVCRLISSRRDRIVSLILARVSSGRFHPPFFIAATSFPHVIVSLA